MTDVIRDLKLCPDPMCKQQFCRVCHISNATGAYLIRLSFVAATRSYGLRGRFRIQQSDILRYLERRQTDRRFYQAPSLNPDRKKREQPFFSTLQALDLDAKTRKTLRKWLRKQLEDLKDTLSCREVCALTGYDLHTLTRWGREGKIPFRLYHNRFLISKAQLIDFLASDAYNGIVRKSEAHCKMISRFCEGSKIS